MAGEKINISSNIENKQWFNFKKELATLFAVLSMQYSLWQQSENKDTIQDNKAKVEVVQQSENPKTADEILKKHNFTDNIAFLAADDIPLDTLLSMWDDTQKALKDCIDQNIKMRLNILDRKLIARITDKWYDLTQRINQISEEEKKLDEEITQLDNELQKSKDNIKKTDDNIKKIDDNIKKISTETEKVKKIIVWLTGKEQ